MSQPDVKSILPPSSASASAPTWPFPVDPSEELAIDAGKANKNIWAVRIPRFLLERWESVDEAGVELGTLVVDNSTNPPKLSLRLPTSSSAEDPSENLVDLTTAAKAENEPAAGPSRRKRKYDTSNIPDEYELHVPDERAKNTFVFSERVRSFGGMDGGKGRREKAYPRLLAAVAHEGTVKPLQNDKYRRILAQRRLESEQTRRPIIQIESTGLSRGELNKLASGVKNATNTFGKGFVATPAHNLDRQTRMDINQLRNRLFQLFNEKPYWGIPALKATLKQPDVYLREVLSEMAEQVKEGRYVNMWRLQDSFKVGEAKAEEGGDGDVKPDLGADVDFDDEEDEEDEEDDGEDEEEDFEEVLQ